MPTKPRPSRTEPPWAGEPGISRTIVTPVVSALASLGYDASWALESGEDVIPGAIADRVFDEAAPRLGDDAIGITVASRLPIGALGILDYALSTSATLLDALRRVAGHYAIATERVRLTLDETAPLSSLVFERDAALVHSRHWIEFSFAVLAGRMRQTVDGSITFHEVAFRHGRPRDTRAHDAFFGTEVRFCEAFDRLVFSHERLSCPLRTASAMLASLLDAKMRELLPRSFDSFTVDVRRVMLDLLEQGDTRLESAASRLRTSRRTLQRELGARGTSHKEMLEDLRRERALVLLDTTSSVAEVAARLGYSDPSAFFRAFRRWTGTSPRARSEASSRGDDDPAR